MCCVTPSPRILRAFVFSIGIRPVNMTDSDIAECPAYFIILSNVFKKRREKNENDGRQNYILRSLRLYKEGGTK